MMFSDYVGVWRMIVSTPLAALVPLLMFTLVFIALWKLFRSLVLGGSTGILITAAAANWLAANSLITSGQYLLATLTGMPLIFMGREAYLRLLGQKP